MTAKAEVHAVLSRCAAGRAGWWIAGW
jgi:hypothetical protein